MNPLPNMTGQDIDKWTIGKTLSYNHHVAYECTCNLCGNTKVITATDLKARRNLACKCSYKHTTYLNDNLTGTQQGSLHIGEAFRKDNRTYYHVTCDCGKEYDILRDNLIQKNAQWCKCLGHAVDPTKKYGMLQPIKRMKDGTWECKCDCGNICYKSPGYLLRPDQNFSCGCKKQANKIKLRVDNRTGIKGVCYVARKRMYCAYISKNGYRYHLGYYNTIQEAANARKLKEEELFGS